jgi:hypothetical protein
MPLPIMIPITTAAADQTLRRRGSLSARGSDIPTDSGASELLRERVRPLHTHGGLDDRFTSSSYSSLGTPTRPRRRLRMREQDRLDLRQVDVYAAREIMCALNRGW